MKETKGPFLLSPSYKDYIWGGNRLKKEYGKETELFPLAESWECSTHKDGFSFVRETGEKLSELLKRHPDFIGTHPLSISGGKPELPIIIKFIDANSNLSVQVHPNDDYAFKRESSLGKTEMWYVLEAEPNSEIIYGFNMDVSRHVAQKAAEEGRIEKYLNHVKASADDVFMIEPGKVHAIGKGCLVAEIQEASNITYRLYDYNRVGKDGKKRELHLNKALDVADLNSSLNPRQPMRVLRYRNGSASELLARCRYFQVERLLINTTSKNPAQQFTGENSFNVLLCYDGASVISHENTRLEVKKGDTVFIPAGCGNSFIEGKACFLKVTC